LKVEATLWLNGDGFPQATLHLRSGDVIVQIPSKDPSGNVRASKPYRAVMDALCAEEVGATVSDKGESGSGSDEVLRRKILNLRKQGRDWADIAVEIGLATQRASVTTRLNSLRKSEVARAIQRDELNDWLKTHDLYGP
jgi:hypothetical protein